MKSFGGRILALDRDDINTDEIIPAKYLTEISKEALKAHLLEDLHLEGFDAGRDIEPASVVLTRANFGCGSSREHAPWALEVNGITAVVAESFARIFRQNMLNGGLLPVSLPKEEIDRLLALVRSGEARATFDLEAGRLGVEAPAGRAEAAFELDGFARKLIGAGGWVDYANAAY